MTPRELCQLIQKDGFRAQLDEDDEDTTDIASGVEGIPFLVSLYRPKPLDGDLESFDSISFTALLKKEETDLRIVNDINSKWLFLKAHVEDGSTYLQMDTAVTSNALTAEIWDEIFGIWTACLPDVARQALN